MTDLEVYQAHPVMRPSGSPAELKSAFDAYQALCRDLLGDADYQEIEQNGKTTRFIKRSGWRKLAKGMGVTCEIISKEKERDADGNIIAAEFVVRATHPNGQFMDGWGNCHRSERKFSKPEHDIPATAETRAKNRACADLFGLGEVSAEEVDGRAPAPAPAAAEPIVDAILADPGPAEPAPLPDAAPSQFAQPTAAKGHDKGSQIFALYKALENLDARFTLKYFKAQTKATYGTADDRRLSPEQADEWVAQLRQWESEMAVAQGSASDADIPF